MRIKNSGARRIKSATTAMAKRDVVCACGHIQEIVLTGSMEEREKKTKWFQTHPCKECRSKEAKEAAAEQGLPELTGSEKQVNWAVTIREKAISVFDQIIEQQKTQELKDDLKDLKDKWLKTKTEAKYWIDYRYDFTTAKIGDSYFEPSKNVVIELAIQSTLKKSDKTEQLLSLPEKEAMYESRYGRVLISAYIDGNLEVALLPRTDRRHDKYKNLIRGVICGYTEDGKITEYMLWPDGLLHPTITVRMNKEFAELVNELKTGLEGMFKGVIDEVSLARILKHYKQQLEDAGVLNEDLRNKYEFFFSRHEI